MKNTADRARVEAGYRLILEGLGIDPGSEHFRGTPERAAKAMVEELASGLFQDGPRATMFEHKGRAQMIIMDNIPVLSMCAHHLLPFIGTATVGYIPGNGKIFGASKFSRITDHFSRRPTVQEVLTDEIADYLWPKIGLEDSGVGVVIRANHMCMRLRGVRHDGDMTTCALRGLFEEDAAVRAEFLSHTRARPGA